MKQNKPFAELLKNSFTTLLLGSLSVKCLNSCSCTKNRREDMQQINNNPENNGTPPTPNPSNDIRPPRPLQNPPESDKRPPEEDSNPPQNPPESDKRPPQNPPEDNDSLQKRREEIWGELLKGNEKYEYLKTTDPFREASPEVLELLKPIFKEGDRRIEVVINNIKSPGLYPYPIIEHKLPIPVDINKLNQIFKYPDKTNIEHINSIIYFGQIGDLHKVLCRDRNTDELIWNYYHQATGFIYCLNKFREFLDESYPDLSKDFEKETLKQMQNSEYNILENSILYNFLDEKYQNLIIDSSKKALNKIKNEIFENKDGKFTSINKFLDTITDNVSESYKFKKNKEELFYEVFLHVQGEKNSRGSMYTGSRIFYDTYKDLCKDLGKDRVKEYLKIREDADYTGTSPGLKKDGTCRDSVATDISFATHFKSSNHILDSREIKKYFEYKKNEFKNKIETLVKNYSDCKQSFLTICKPFYDSEILPTDQSARNLVTKQLLEILDMLENSSRSKPAKVRLSSPFPGYGFYNYDLTIQRIDKFCNVIKVNMNNLESFYKNLEMKSIPGLSPSDKKVNDFFEATRKNLDNAYNEATKYKDVINHYDKIKRLYGPKIEQSEESINKSLLNLDED